jgi:hypothetical protein
MMKKKPKSKLLHRPETQYGFVPKHSLHGGKNIALRAEKPFFPTFFRQRLAKNLKKVYICNTKNLKKV